MHHHYHDIRSRIHEEPQWFDEHAVPRYSVFTPDETADIYADEAALVEIACQACGKRFLVCMTWNTWKSIRSPHYKSLHEQIVAKSLHYGDPPNVECCPAGPTMNCEDIRVLEYWAKNYDRDWVRHPELEIVLDEYYGGFAIHDPNT